MKYNKIVSLLALGTLFGPTLLSSQQVFAEESSTVASNSATTSSSQQTTESSSTGGTESSETPTPEPVKQYNLLKDGAPIANNTPVDLGNGNSISFQYSAEQGLIANSVVHYSVSLAKGFELKEVKLVNNATQVPISANANINGQFSMPDADVSVQVEVVAKPEEKPTPSTPKPEEKPNGNTGTNNSGNQNTGNTNTNQPANNSNNAAAQQPADNNSAARQPEADASAAPADVRVPSNQNAPTFSNEVQTAIVQEAYRHLGKPYVWGAKGPNAFDCSGLA